MISKRNITESVSSTRDDPVSLLEERYNTDVTRGLTSKQVELNQDGINEIVTKKESIWKLYFAPLFDTLITIYIIMALILFVLSRISNNNQGKVSFWLTVVAINMLLAIYQQYRAQKKLEALEQLSSPTASVMRNGILQEIDAKEIVVGDIVVLDTGSRVPADGVLISVDYLKVNEASLTGEPLPRRKFRISDPLDLNNPNSRVYLSTFVQVGTGKFIVTAIGSNTELGKIADSIASIDSTEIPLRSKVNVLGKWLGSVMIVFLVVLFTHTMISKLNAGEDFGLVLLVDVISWSIINAMAVMPINIPLLTTVVLLTGILNMANQQVVVKKLSAVESLGRSSVLCSDKTGTITSATMTPQYLWMPDQLFKLNFEKGGSILKVDTLEEADSEVPITDLQSDDIMDELNQLSDLIHNAIYNNGAKEVLLDGKLSYQGNATDIALMELLPLKYKLVQEGEFTTRLTFPFDSAVKRMSTIVQHSSLHSQFLYCKGAPEQVLELCSRVLIDNQVSVLDSSTRLKIISKIHLLAERGYRVLGFASKPLQYISNFDDLEDKRDQVEKDLVFTGLCILYDPPRKGVRQSVELLKSAGVKPVMITGDALQTASMVAREVGMMNDEHLAVEGNEVEQLSDEEFMRVSVFARVAPIEKEIIVSRYQENQKIVTMTGDGVNDAIALSRSDTGVAMGISGTEVAKESADIILTDDRYVSITRGIEEGRNLYEKIRIMIFFYIAVNLAEAIMYFVFSLDVGFHILNNYQRGYIFTIVHSLPVLAIIFGPSNSAIMKDKPRDNDALITRKLAISLVSYSLSLALVLIIMYRLFLNEIGLFDTNVINTQGIASFVPIGDLAADEMNPLSLSHAKARTILLTIIYLAEVMLVLSIIRINTSIFQSLRDLNWFVYICLVVPLVIHFTLMYSTNLQIFLTNFGITPQLVPLSALDLGIVVIVALLPILLLELVKYYFRRKNLQL